MMQAAYMHQQQQQQQAMYNPHLAAPMPSVVDFSPGVIPNLQQVAEQNTLPGLMPAQPTNMNEQIFHRERVRTAVHQAVSAGINDYESRHKCDVSQLKSQLHDVRTRERQLQRKMDAQMSSRHTVRSGCWDEDDRNGGDSSMYPPEDDIDNRRSMRGASRHDHHGVTKKVTNSFADRERRYEVARALYETAKEDRDASLHM